MARRLTPGWILLCLLLAIPRVFGFGVEITPAARTRKNPVIDSGSVLSKAKDDFDDHCTPCHGGEGRGDGPLAKDLKTRPKDLTNRMELAGLTDGEIFWIITTGKDPMPSFARKLTDEERWGLVHLLRRISKTAPNSVPHHP